MLTMSRRRITSCTKMSVPSVRNREVLFFWGGSLILRCGDFNLIITHVLDAVFKIVLKTYFLYIERRYCHHLPDGLTFEIK